MVLVYHSCSFNGPFLYNDVYFFWGNLKTKFPSKLKQQVYLFWGKVVAQSAEWSFLTPEVLGSNLAIGNFYQEHLFTLYVIEITKRN